MGHKTRTGALGALGTAALVVLASCGGGSGASSAERASSTSRVGSTSTTSRVSTTSPAVRRSVEPTADFCALLVHNESTFTLDVDFAPKHPAAQAARLTEQMQHVLVVAPLLDAAAPAALERDVATTFHPWEQYARAVLSRRRDFPPGVINAVFGGDAKVSAAARHLATVCGINVPARRATSAP